MEQNAHKRLCAVKIDVEGSEESEGSGASTAGTP